jgi:hypothetical protein
MGLGGPFNRLALLRLLLGALLTITIIPSDAQSTAGSIFGTVKDPSGALVVGAKVTLTNTGTVATRSTATDRAGNYVFQNVEAGAYQLTVVTNAFAKSSIADLDEQTRENKRVDVALTLGSTTETVTVEGTEIGVVTADESSLSQTTTGRELLELPVGLTSRAAGSTSPFLALTTEPGVQTDGSNMVIAGATPSMQSFTLDGISVASVENSTSVPELFPSENGISEIRVSESNNNAEYSGIVDVTTTSKSGTNQIHGGTSEVYETKGFNANNPYASQKPNLVMNNFGIYAGGPVSVPHLYSGRDKTFFFMDYEGLRLPQTSSVTLSVPTAAMRQGNICTFLDAENGVSAGSEPLLFQPNGVQIPCNAVPVNTTSANVMKYLYPQPTDANPSHFVNNYSQLFADGTNVDQGDLRIDRVISPKQSVYGRLSYKYIASYSPTNTPPFGSESHKTTDAGFVLADSYILTPNLVIELRGGANGFDTEGTFNANGVTLLAGLDITGIANVPIAPETPSFTIGGFESGVGGDAANASKSRTFQVFDNLTWTKKAQTVKFGADVRRVAAVDSAIDAFGGGALGFYNFQAASVFAQTAANPSGTTGDPFAEFLLGFPDQTFIAESTDPGMSAWAYAEAVYAQDSWTVARNLTVNFGMRWEIHPPLQMHHSNAAGFLPDYFTTVNGTPVHGAVVAPNEAGLSIAQPAWIASIAPTPRLTASQAGIPAGLRFTDKSDFGPRVGFAWRLFGNDKTVVRGGWGRYVEPPLGDSAYRNWADDTTNIPSFSQGTWNGTAPLLRFPQPFAGPAGGATPVGDQNFEDVYDLHYRDSAVYQYNLTFERDLGYGVGIRLGYTGNKGTLLGAQRDLNQVAPNTVGISVAALSRPYPLWNILDEVFNGAQSNYNSLSAVASKRFSHGLQFQSSYAYTRDLSDAGGGTPSRLPGVAGSNTVSTWGADPKLDYGNVSYDRRHRVLNTFLYELPLGTGKRYLSNTNAFVRDAVGGWQISGILVDQTGAFLTPYWSGVDPSGTGTVVNSSEYPASRADVVKGVSPHSPSNTFCSGCISPTGAEEHIFLKAAAFSNPGNNIGSFATEPVGYVTGPGEHNVSISLKKAIELPEHFKMEFDCAAANILNHRNYGNPSLDVSAGPGSFGVINSLQGNESGGPRFLQLTGRITF